MNKREKDRVSSLLFLAVAIGICYGSIRLSLGDIHSPGPGFFPFLVGGILCLLSLAVFLRSLSELPGDERKPFWPNPKRHFKMAYVIIALILYTIGMNYLGFSLTTFLFLVFLMRYIDPQRWSVVLSVSILSTIIALWAFKYWLDVSLPTGILGF
jgi:putative tricarboxylic transport membrane protein